MIRMSSAMEMTVSQDVSGRPTQPRGESEVGRGAGLRGSGRDRCRSGRDEVAASSDDRSWTSWSPFHGCPAIVDVTYLDPLTHAAVTVCRWCSGLWEVSFPLDCTSEGAVALWIA